MKALIEAAKAALKQMCEEGCPGVDELDAAITAAEARVPQVETSVRRLLVIREVVEERKRQDAQWGGPAHDDTHGVGDWWDYVMSQMEKLNARPGEAQERFVKIAALAIAALESMSRKASKGGAA